ncbi:probable arabinose 5-phosphate isomerase [Hibiscus syriacus]|uniref:probable arabinose 5-phosphate isomerase n=1 Tax=Hibiscus syriacus TaxID=106335 RepID=UPI001920D19A|nr:probable arabinose 5-phosphate isomerase [Hibiscus syriacus]
MTMLMNMMNDMIHGGKPLEDSAVNAINEVLNNDEFDMIVSDDQEPISEYEIIRSENTDRPWDRFLRHWTSHLHRRRSNKFPKLPFSTSSNSNRTTSITSSKTLTCPKHCPSPKTPQFPWHHFLLRSRKIGIFRQQDLPNPSFLGIRSSFLSPLDALHGDIGAISSADVLVLFSKSGSTEELLCLFPSVRAKGAYLISVTSVSNNALSNACDLNMHFPLERELCPFNLAPVTSTAIQMVFGDTVAIALMGARNLTKEQYAANHPAGRIGKSLFSR